MALKRPPYDRELSIFLEDIRDTLVDRIDINTIGERRTTSAVAQPTIASLIGDLPLEHFEKSIPGPVGAPELTLSIIRRHDTEFAPCVYNIHGGGMMFGNRFFGGKSQVDIADKFGATVVSVEYRLAPENPHPAPADDCYACLEWLAAHGAEIGIDPSRIMLYGSSAGGGLAASVSLMARDRGGPHLIGQLLVAPMLDDRNNTISALQYDDPMVWNRFSNEVGWTALLGDARGGPDVSPYAAPARATDLSGLPPTFIDVGSAEVFRDEDMIFAERIWAAGGEAELHVWQGVFHGAGRAEFAEVTIAADKARLSWMKRIFEAASS